jgi:hypothetical protein
MTLKSLRKIVLHSPRGAGTYMSWGGFGTTTASGMMRGERESDKDVSEDCLGKLHGVSCRRRTELCGCALRGVGRNVV